MHLININEKISGELQNYVRNGLKLYVCKDNNFNVYIFTIVFDESMLKNHWEKIQNKVALDFQSTIEKEIELWNIYIVFFIENMMEQKDLKYKIENDHYCARKIILDDVGNIKDDEKKIKELISKKLFDLEVPKISEVNNIDDLEKELKLIDSRLINLSEINKLINNYKD